MNPHRPPSRHPPRATYQSTVRGASIQKVRRLVSHDLFSGETEVEIDHHGVLYRLRLTAQGKLILTK